MITDGPPELPERPTRTRALWSHVDGPAGERCLRDAMVLDLIAQGWSRRAVAELLMVSPALICRIARRGCKRLRIREIPVDEGPRLPGWLAKLSAPPAKG